MKFWSILCLVVIAAIILVGCIVSEKEFSQMELAMGLRPGFPPVELEPIGFELRWESHLGDREVANIWLINHNFYVETKGHWLYKIDGKSGYVLWVCDIGAKIEKDPFLYTYEESEKEILKKYNEIYILASDAIHCVDEGIGWLVFKHNLRYTPSSPPFASASHLYYGSWDNRLRAIDKETKAITWECVTGDDIVAGGAQKDPTIFFLSEDGKTYCLDASRGTERWVFKGQRAFSATPCFYKNRLYAGCRDYNIYSIRTVDGTLDWRFPCEAEVVDTPVAVDGGGLRHGTVFCRARNKWFYAINRKDGKERWRLREGLKLLLLGRKSAYVLTSTGDIACVNNESGKVQWKKPFSDVDFFVVNDADRRTIRKGLSDYLIFFGYRNAWFFCIREKDIY